jgi:diadenosine tetraphosphate (Ap4A) HIT family hydrolase
MVLSKAHVPLLADLAEDDGRHIFTVAQRAATAIRESGLRCEGINVFLADGEAAFQEIPHFHLHVFPRFVGDPFKLVSNWDIKPERPELEQHAGLIRRAFERLYGC